MFSSVLIANRGEIAIRIARTARRLGMKTIAVASRADRDSIHLKAADEQVFLDAATPWGGYLDVDAIVNAAVGAGAECLHPGYGFLSENPLLSELCSAKGITFVGPSAAAIRKLGHKDSAKELMEGAGVPVLPGYRGEMQDAPFLRAEAHRIGYPVMIKAVSGGGGRGMRKVSADSELEEALDACQREALAAFGDARVLLEKFIDGARHIEVQVIADRHGNCVHLLERECSLQRRHQKVIEEAPAPGMSPGLRRSLGAAAVKGAIAAGYTGAGTMEFIAPHDLSSFYFMEMNTRLQVEHPVTELITGLDLVELQFRVAAGQKLDLDQDDITPRGHAVEARLYAEDPSRDFLPQTGRIHVLRWPDAGESLRIDSGVVEGSDISPHYDPMVAKLITHGKSRREAFNRLHTALLRTEIAGIRTNQHFLARLASNRDIVSGPVNTGFIGEQIDRLTEPTLLPKEQAVAAATWAAATAGQGGSPWERGPWTLAGSIRHTLVALLVNGEEVLARIRPEGTGRWHVVLGEYEMTVEPAATRYLETGSATLFLTINAKQIDVKPVDQLARQAGALEGSSSARAPMTGKVTKVFARPGDTVRRGDPILVLEAMKMEHVVRAGMDGVISTLFASVGSAVIEGALLCAIDPAPQESASPAPVS
jgi:3-methylcrotonyl-CoA carboxylase alpha subunit